jgi:hypothetical protein
MNFQTEVVSALFVCGMSCAAFCCFFLWFTFPCVCVWRSPAVITDPAVCSHDSCFLVSVCYGHQQSLQHLLADAVRLQPTPEAAECQFCGADGSLEETQPSLHHCGEQSSEMQCPMLGNMPICTVYAACVLEYWSCFRYYPVMVTY